jgi:hypothetical protein
MNKKKNSSSRLLRHADRKLVIDVSADRLFDPLHKDDRFLQNICKMLSSLDGVNIPND